ncbi:adenylyltransferase/cytidyltransferase family protein [Patescibacteria group bacterium]
MSKIKNLNQIKSLSRKAHSNGQTVGLTTGCFDIIHTGHVNLFRFAKRHVDLLIVGVENDRNVNKSKGVGRPVHTSEKRIDLLSELESVDYVFEIKKDINYNVKTADKDYSSLYRKVDPTHIFTTPKFDNYHKNKQKIARVSGIQYLALKKPLVHNSTTLIIQKTLNGEVD